MGLLINILRKLILCRDTVWKKKSAYFCCMFLRNRLARICVLFVLSFTGVEAAFGQRITEADLRIAATPEKVMLSFKEAGMDPTVHSLTSEELQKVERAFLILPPLHQTILQKHLKSISFLDGMPNTALTSPVESEDSLAQFNITFRAGILQETVTEWLNKKEATCFKIDANDSLSVWLDGGELDAIQYIFLHEATHVVDAVLALTPKVAQVSDIPVHTDFTAGIWSFMNKPSATYLFPVLEGTRFRSGKVVSRNEIAAIYDALDHTPFVSLYGMASWHEDIAEFLTVYHLTQKLNQPFRIIIKKGDQTIHTYEPIHKQLAKERFKYMDVFYRG